jgi:hypothetical protein
LVDHRPAIVFTIFVHVPRTDLEVVNGVLSALTCLFASSKLQNHLTRSVTFGKVTLIVILVKLFKRYCVCLPNQSFTNTSMIHLAFAPRIFKLTQGQDVNVNQGNEKSLGEDEYVEI